MPLKEFLARLLAKRAYRKNKKWISHPLETQQKVFNHLIRSASPTAFGKDHDFKTISTYRDFSKRVPIRDYEALKPYIERIRTGERNVLWAGKPIYFAKTSGTTSGVKYIPITKASMPTHIIAARDAILNYIYQTGNTKIIRGKMIFLQGSPILSKHNGIMIGRLSGIVAHHVPRYLQSNKMPSWRVNCIDDWEEKVNAVAEETLNENMTIIGGIPSWVQMYFDRLIDISKKNKIKEIFQNFSLFVFGGINYEPYKSKMESLIGGAVDSIELYPASEGFFAYQDCQNHQGMLLLLDLGIFYEFVKVEDLNTNDPNRISLADVCIGQNYLMIISTTAGLWAYDLGDVIEFTSLAPYRIRVTGRSKHYISAFGEHVIAKEVEYAITKTAKEMNLIIVEFTVAPMINPLEGKLPHHQWFIEFDKPTKKLEAFASALDQAMQEQNIYYKDLIQGKILQPLSIQVVQSEGFSKFMKTKGRLGGQNKIQRLSNDRSIVDDSDFVSLLVR